MEPKTIQQINQIFELKNNQMTVSKRAWWIAGFSFVLCILPFQSWSPLAGAWALAFISFFVFLVSVVIGFMLRSRGKKLQKLISKEDLLASWQMKDAQKKAFVSYLFEQEIGKNTLILFIISLFAIIIFGLFILFIDDGKLFMFAVLIGLIVFLSAFAFGMPYYYRYKNNKGNGWILLGKKYAYINGYFHNWDFPLSGLRQVKEMKAPFRGIQMTYYYTDATLKHHYTLNIPVPEEIDIDELIYKLKNIDN